MEEDKKNYSSPYLMHSLDALQRIVSLTNIDNLSSTFGCSHRDYWLYKTSDFPDAVRNFSSHSFALASIHPFFNKTKQYFFRELAKSSILYWSSIQHSDGSYDEFYPYERGWVGPTAFTLYSNIEAYKIVSEEFSKKNESNIMTSFKKAASYIAAGDKEGDDLANHHAMAYLSLTKAHELLESNKLKKDAKKSFQNFLKYHLIDEGWSIEYDGIDPGYLSASCSFLAKTLDIEYSQDIFEIIKIYSKTLKPFCYPDGCFSGPIGSRNTMHLYPYAFELLAKSDPNINYISKFSQFSINSGNCITPNIMSDRYVHYRVEEYLITDKLFLEKKATIKKDFVIEKNETYLPKGGIYHFCNANEFLTVNLSKNLVLDKYKKVKNNKKWKRTSFTGIRILDKSGLYSSQFISKNSKATFNKEKIKVKGYLAKIPTENSFNIFKNLIFRILLIFCSNSTNASNYLKKSIRKLLMFSKFKKNYYFETSFDLLSNELIIKIESNKIIEPLDLQIGTNISDRYVPQSRFSRSSDQNLNSSLLNESEKNTVINELKNYKFSTIRIKI